MRRVTKLFVVFLLIVQSVVYIEGIGKVHADVEGDYEYEPLDDGTVEITKYTGSDTDITIPGELGEKVVTSIGDQAFLNNELTSVVIPDSVTSIGNYAFSENKLISVEIPDSVTSIGNYAFRENKLISVEIPDSVTSIGSSAFRENQLIDVIISVNVRQIGSGAFRENHLKDVKIPVNVINIGSYAFYGNQLTNVIIPDGVINIDQSAFRENQLTNVIIPDSVRSIGSSAFSRNQLEGVVIPNSVTSIGIYAFHINKLTSVEIPNSVTSIGNGTFRENLLTSVEIPDSVTSIGEFAFYENELTSVVIPDSVTSIGSDAFANNQTNSEDLTIIGHDLSEAWNYANDNNHTFKNGAGEVTFNLDGNDTWSQTHHTEVELENFNSDKEILYAWSDSKETPDSDSDWKTLGSETELEIENVSGDYYLHIKGEDISRSKFIAVSKPFKLDNTDPELSFELSPSGTTNGDVEITATGSDAHSGVTSITDPDGIVVNETSVTYTVSKNGIYNFEAKDKAGNIVEETIEVNIIDTEEPEVSLTPNGGDYAENHETEIIASDSGSGIQTIEYQWTMDETFPDSGDFEEISSGDSVNTPTESGDYYLHVKATDKAGNISEFTSDVFKVDNTRPTKPEIHATTDWTKSDVTVSVTGGTDIHSGVDRTEYRIGNSGDWIKYEDSFKITDEGQTTIYARTIDKVGNISDETEKTVKIDRTSPNLNLIGSNPVNILFNEEFIDPGYDVKDNLDENIQDKVIVDGVVDTEKVGSYEITYYVKDHAGNETTVIRTVNVNDGEQPVITLNGDNPYILEVGTPFDDPSATAIDDVDGDISNQIMISGEVDTNKLGTYYLYYNVSDNYGNEAFEAVREVHVVAPDVILLELDQSSVPVYAGSTVKINNTQTKLILPSDLPEGTTLHVNRMENLSVKGFITNAEEIERAGDVLNFNFEFPNSYESYQGDFVLTMSYGNDFSTDIDIYYYNESDKRWKAQNGTKDTSNKTITINPNHFSTYGVFALKEDDESGDSGNGGSSGSSDNSSPGNGDDKTSITINGDSEKEGTQETNGQKLPKTATNNFNMIGIGLVLILIGSIFFLFIRRKTV